MGREPNKPNTARKSTATPHEASYRSSLRKGGRPSTTPTTEPIVFNMTKIRSISAIKMKRTKKRREISVEDTPEPDPVLEATKVILQNKRRASSLQKSPPAPDVAASANSSGGSTVLDPLEVPVPPTGPPKVYAKGLGMGKGKSISMKAQRPRKSDNPVKIKDRTVMGEIRRLQNTTDLIIPRAPFHRLVREIFKEIAPENVSLWQSAALIALQEAAENFLTRLFEDSYLCSHHAKRVTLFVSDMQLCMRLQRSDIAGRLK